MMTEQEARQRAETLITIMGEGWESDVWDNLGWRVAVRKGSIRIYDFCRANESRYSAWIEPGFNIGRTVFQIIESADTPTEALERAKQKAQDVISRLRAALTDLEPEIQS